MRSGRGTRKKQLKKQLKYYFKAEAEGIEISDGTLHNVISLANQELIKKSQKPKLSFWEFLILQIKYMGVHIWIMQGFLLTAVCALLPFLSQQDFMYLSPRRIAILLCCFSTLLAMNAIPFAYRSIHYRMWEVETASHFSVMRLLAVKSLLVGVGDIAVLCAVFAVIRKNALYEGNRTLFYLLIPFLLVRCGSLFLQRHIPLDKLQAQYGWICLGLLTGIFLMSRYAPICFEQSFSVRWIGISLALMFACLYQLWRLIYSGYEDYHSVFG